VVDLEADGVADCGSEHALGASVEDDVAVEEAEVDRQSHRSLRGEEDEAADTSAGEMRLALFPGQDVEVWVRSGASGARRPVDIATAQVRGRGLEGGGEPKQYPGQHGRHGGVLEVVEVAGIHLRASCELLL